MPSEPEPRLEGGLVESAGTAPKSARFPLWAWASVLGLAVVIRAVNFAFLCDHPLITHPQVDSAFYDLWARDAARGADLGTRMLWSAPLYPSFVTAIYRAFGPSVHAVMVVQHLVGVLVTAAFVCLLLRLTSPRLALVGGLVWAAYPLNAYYEVFLLPTSMIVGLGIVAALAVLNATQSVSAEPCEIEQRFSRCAPGRGHSPSHLPSPLAGPGEAQDRAGLAEPNRGPSRAHPVPDLPASSTPNQGESTPGPQPAAPVDLRATRTAVSGASGTPRKNELGTNAFQTPKAAALGERDEIGLGKAWIAGLVWGLLALASDNYLYFSVLLLPLFWPRLRSFGVFLLGVVLVVAPIAIRNYRLTGELIPISAHGGEAVYIANNPRTDGLYNPLYNGFQKLTGHELQRTKASKMAGRELNYGEANRFWMRKALDFAVSKPRRYLRLLGSKLLLAAHATELPNTEDYRYFRTQSPVFRFNPLHFGLIFPFGVVGLLACLAERRRLGVLYLMFLVSAVPVLAVFATSRYRMPLMPFLTAFAVLGGVQLWRRLRDPNDSPVRLFGLLATFLAALFLSNRPWPRLDAGRDWSPVQMGRIALAERQPEAAIAPLEEALRIDDSNGGTMVLLARAYARAGRPEAAFHRLQQAERTNPNKRAVWREMASLLIELGRCDAAVAPLERLLAANPKDTQAAAALTHCQATNGQAH